MYIPGSRRKGETPVIDIDKGYIVDNILRTVAIASPLLIIGTIGKFVVNQTIDQNLFEKTYTNTAEFKTYKDFTLAEFGLRNGGNKTVLIEHAGMGGGKHLAEELEEKGISEVNTVVFTNWENAGNVLAVLNADNVFFNEETLNKEGKDYIKNSGINNATICNFEGLSLDGLHIKYDGAFANIYYNEVVYKVGNDYSLLDNRNTNSGTESYDRKSGVKDDDIDIKYVITPDEKISDSLGQKGYPTYTIPEDGCVVTHTNGVSFDIDYEMNGFEY